MKKRTKIMLGTMLPVSLLGVVSSTLFITSCSSTESSGFNEELFKTNNGERYMDLTNTGISSDNDVMKTTNVANTLLATKDGTSSYISTYSDQFLVDWFSKTNDSILSTYYSDQLKTIEDEYNDKKTSFTDMNLFQREVLDPTGGTKETYIYDQLISKLKQQLSDSLFSRDYLGIQVGDGENARIIRLDSQDAEAQEALKNKDNINGVSGAGTRNRFVFSERSVASYTDLDKYYADFINFIFEKWSRETLPIITPAVLFKHSTGTSPENSGLFSTQFFGKTPLEGTDSNYKFQWFDPATTDYMSPNSSMKYASFVAGMNNFVDADTGAINIPKYLTDDSSTMLITNGKTCYLDFVTPFAAAAMYNFSNLVFNTSGIQSSTLNSNDIMANFLSTDASTPTGYFALPYSNDTGFANAFSGSYANTKSVRETFKVSNATNGTPFIATRDEFGVHIIGIDRYDQIKQAVQNKTGTEAFNSALIELQNTILWRNAQRLMTSNDSSADNISLDLKSTLKTYYDDNASTLIFEYLESKKNDDTGAYLFGSKTIKEDSEKLIDITSDSETKTLLQKAVKLSKIEDAIEFVNTIKDKMYTLQSSYATNDKPSAWKSNGLAGVLPYTRSSTGNFDQLIDIVLKLLNVTTDVGATNSIESSYTSAKTELAEAIQALKLEAATKANYFKPDSKIGEQVGVSQYEFVNNWNVNQILVKDSSANDVVSLYNKLWDNKQTNDNLKTFTSPIANPNTFEQNVANAIIDQIPSNYTIAKAFGSSEQKVAIGLDYSSLTNLKSSATNWINKQISDNKVGNDYSLIVSANAEFQTFLKTLTWLLTPTSKDDETETLKEGQYSFANLITVLKEIIENEYTGVGYIGWSVQSNLYANPGFGENLTTDFSYKNPALMTNITNYSYFDAPNLISNINNIYYGTDQMYFNSAKMSKNDNDVSNGFLGFQSSSTSLTTSALPTELFNGTLLTQNTADANNNFTGLYYRFNKDGNNDADSLNKAREEMKTYIKEANTFYQIREIATQIRTFGFNILSKNIVSSDENIGTVSISDALRMIISGQNLTANNLTIAQMQGIMDLIIDQIPSQAFAQIQAKNLYNNNSSSPRSNVFIDDTTANTTQYVVTQFNQSDIERFENWVTTTASRNFTDMEFAGMDMSAFFASIVLLAQNAEVQSRSSTHWSNISKEKKIVVYNYLVAQKLGESVVENWDDFK